MTVQSATKLADNLNADQWIIGVRNVRRRDRKGRRIQRAVLTLRYTLNN